MDLLQAGFLDAVEPFIPDNFIYDAEDFQELESLKGPGLIQSKKYRDAAIALQAKKREEFVREAVGIPLDADLDTTDNIVRALGDPTSLIGVGKTGAKNAAILAAEILSLQNEQIRNKLSSWKISMTNDVPYKPE